ncbi:alanine racemase [Marinoscillum furvescens]|uniref:Alanine racemase n=1 Tax=Marinoscillum furvescens DSM 4134 TaxID=1122208 RepID=A0A3D9L585_MARFU|nr:alanine racemase [Marinoscillum furvescens]REE00110.1 alanine racemase [Marinoscillum furvescens DSM 4134]
MVRHSSRIELSQSSLTKNINFIRKKIGPGVRISSVVKANAYGHGIHQFVKMAEKAGVDHFAAASAFEAEEVLEARSAGSDIMIMGILYKEDIDWAISNGIEFYVFNYERLPYVLERAQALGIPAKVHIEVETGANRTGMQASEFPDTLKFLKKHAKDIHFKGLCTHFGGAESFSNQFKITSQHERYKEFLKQCEKRKMLPEIRHIACSAAALAYKDTVYDMVRMGVSQYGFWPSPDIYYLHMQEQGGRNNVSPLKRIFTWKTDVMDVRDVRAGEFIGYGTAYQATQDMRVAVLPLGYSNGYPRGQSNRGYVLIKGKKAPVVGLINMNLFMVDVSHIPDVEVGEEVVLVGKQKNNTINISSFTQVTQLMNNEMLSRLPAAIPRKIVK